MGLFLVVPVLAFSLWVIITTPRTLLREKFDRAWWIRLLVLTIIGVGVGTWFSFFKNYESEQLRFSGFPIPITIFREQEGVMRNISPPMFIQVLGRIANFLMGIALSMAPIKFAAFIIRERKEVAKEEDEREQRKQQQQ
jgi:hypothetical protein